MKKVERLRGREVFAAVRTGGKVLDGQFLRLYYDLHEGKRVPIGIGIVMGRRHGSAVLRNRIKRRIREAFYEVLGPDAGMLATKHLLLSVVVVFKGSRQKSIDRLSYDDIRGDAARFSRAIQSLTAGDQWHAC